MFSSYENLKPELKKGILSSFGLKLVNTLFNLFLSIVLARTLAPEGYGVYTFSLSFITLLSVLAHLGLPNLVIREVSRYHHCSQWGLLKGILKRANQAACLFSLVTCILTGCCLILFSHRLTGPQLTTMFLALFLLPLGALNYLREAALQGLLKVVQGQIPDKIVHPLLFLTLIAAASYTIDLTPPMAMAIHCICAMLTFLLGSFLLLRALPSPIHKAEPVYDTQKWLSSVIPLSFLAGLSVVNAQVDFIMLGLLAAKQDVGLYRVAFSGAALVIFTLAAANIALSPYISRIYSAGDNAQLQRIVTGITRIIFLSALPVAGSFIFFGGSILELVFGPSYRPASTALAILCFAQMINVSVGPVHAILNMTGHERATVKAATLSAICNVTLNAALIPLFTIVGAAIASSVSIAVVNIFLLFSLKKRTGIWSFIIPIPFSTKTK